MIGRAAVQSIASNGNASSEGSFVDWLVGWLFCCLIRSAPPDCTLPARWLGGTREQMKGPTDKADHQPFLIVVAFCFSVWIRFSNLVFDIHTRAPDNGRSDEQLTTLREGLARRLSSVVYGVTTGPELSDMEPFPETASRFLQEVRISFRTVRCWEEPT